MAQLGSQPATATEISRVIGRPRDVVTQRLGELIERMRRIGVLMQYSESDPEGQIRVKALEQTLRKLGWTEGSNLQVDYRWAGGDDDRFRAHAAELVRLGEDAIVRFDARGQSAAT